MVPSPLVSHLEAMALGWEKVAVFGSEASCKVTMFMTCLALWCKPHHLLLISVGCPMDSLCAEPQRQQWSSQSCSKLSPDSCSTAGECTAPQPLQTCT